MVTDAVQLPRLTLAWLSPPRFSPGDAELDVVAQVLGGGKNSRLYKRLVYEMQIAQDVSGYQDSASLRVDLPDRGDGAAAARRVGAAGPRRSRAGRGGRGTGQASGDPADTREFQRAINQIEASFYKSLERVGGFGGRADRLNLYYTFTGNPDYFDEDLGRIGPCRPRDVQAAAQAYLPRTGVSSWSSCPKRRRPASDPPPFVPFRSCRPGSRLLLCSAVALPVPAAAQSPDRSKAPAPGAAPDVTLPPSSTHARQRPPGLDRRAARGPDRPGQRRLEAGAETDPAGKFGVASLMADMLLEGAGTRDSLALADAIDFLGADIATGAGFDSARRTAEVPVARLSEALPLLADVVQRRRSPAELDRLDRNA